MPLQSQVLGGRLSPSLWIAVIVAMSVITKTTDNISGRSIVDASAVGIANIPTEHGSATGQSGIVAQFSTGHDEPSAICIMGAEVIEAIAP